MHCLFGCAENFSIPLYYSHGQNCKKGAIEGARVCMSARELPEMMVVTAALFACIALGIVAAIKFIMEIKKCQRRRETNNNSNNNGYQTMELSEARRQSNLWKITEGSSNHLFSRMNYELWQAHKRNGCWMVVEWQWKTIHLIFNIVNAVVWNER